MADDIQEWAIWADGHSGEWKSIGQNAMLKGLRRSPKYYPAIGEICRVSGPNCDNADGFTWSIVQVLWRDDLFIVTRSDGCWPTVTKLELALFEPIPDPLLIEAREMVAVENHDQWTDSSWHMTEAEELRAGNRDYTLVMKAAYLGIRRGLELASQQGDG